jgi:hypothetical protein
MNSIDPLMKGDRQVEDRRVTGLRVSATPKSDLTRAAFLAESGFHAGNFVADSSYRVKLCSPSMNMDTAVSLLFLFTSLELPISMEEQGARSVFQR